MNVSEANEKLVEAERNCAEALRQQKTKQKELEGIIKCLQKELAAERERNEEPQRTNERMEEITDQKQSWSDDRKKLETTTVDLSEALASARQETKEERHKAMELENDAEATKAARQLQDRTTLDMKQSSEAELQRGSEVSLLPGLHQEIASRPNCLHVVQSELLQSTKTCSKLARENQRLGDELDKMRELNRKEKAEQDRGREMDRREREEEQRRMEDRERIEHMLKRMENIADR